MIKVNYILQHKNAFIKISQDKDITAIDISIYNALFLIWNNCSFADEISINRNDVMNLAKVGNKNTYTSSLKRLNEKGFITYKPSNNPLIGSKVSITIFGKGGGKSSDISSGKSDGTSDGTLYKQYNTITEKQINIILDYFDSLPSDVLQDKINELKPFEETYKIDFGVFWDLYDKKKGNKDKVKIKWDNLSLSTQEKIIETLPKFKNSISDKQYQPYPEVYLNNKRWEDELEENTETKEEYTGYKPQIDWVAFLKEQGDDQMYDLSKYIQVQRAKENNSI